ncbi:Mitochondrial domain-containing protein [Cladophialophora immunda]|nr:Mitochondrial domain-containing protein [Cladophialophora immunda]
MFNTSLRRVARTCTNAPAVPSRPSTPTVASFTSNAHQRRHSSSKPPIPPNNGSPAIPAASVKQVGAPRSESKRPGAESRLSKKRSSKDKAENKETQDDWTSKLPAVPSLQHLNPKDVYVASFFSTHRPMSITGPVPPEASIEAVDKIFQPKPKSRSRTSSALTKYGRAEGGSDQSLMQRNEAPADPNRTHHLDGAPQTIQVAGGNIKLVIQEIQRRFRPFNVPPVPRPISDAEINASEEQSAAQAERGEELQAKALEVEIEQQDYNDPYIQQVVINVPRDSSDLQSEGFFTSRGASIREIENPDASSSLQEIEQQSPLGRSRIIGHRRQIGSIPSKRREGMYAISVKRQRRLKMKKHKYKKLMRKTRNLRRKLGQI